MTVGFMMSDGTLLPMDIVEQQAARCVQCALCLPHCPTFQFTNAESESPRGRIALARAIASGQLNDEAAWKHLDSCLACNACGNMCPSKVDYARLREAIYRLDSRGNSFPQKLAIVLLGSKLNARTMAARLGWIFNKKRLLR